VNHELSLIFSLFHSSVLQKEKSSIASTLRRIPPAIASSGIEVRAYLVEVI